MEVCDARRLPLLLGSSPSFRPSFFLLTKSHFRFFCYQKHLGNAFKFYPRRRMSSCCSTFSIMSVRKSAKRDAPPIRLCKVLWCIEADLADGQQVYVTGDPIELGCWEPEVAVLLSPTPEEATMWKAEIKVPCGANFKYNYFIKDGIVSSSTIRWREGPDFSLSVPVNCKKKEKVVVRDSWMMKEVSRNPVHSWESWLLEADVFSPQSKKNLTGDVSTSGEREGFSGQNIHSSSQELLKADLLFKDEVTALGNGAIDVAGDLGSNTCPFLLEWDECCEEPWLLYSPVSDSVIAEIQDNSPEPLNKEVNGTSTVESEEDSDISVAKEPVSTVILINSSVCTMQRIAILEDGKLVELLLEPVKNNVQCDSVYLGIVTKLVPHMGGAFVDIGISRPSLMDIKPNREPFSYPPFNTKLRNNESNVANVIEMKDHVEATLKEEDGGDIDFLNSELQDDGEQFMHEGFEDHEPEINLESFATHKVHVNGNAVDYDGDETDFEDDFDETGHDNGEENGGDFVPLDGQSLNDFNSSSHVLKDSKVSDGTCSDINKWAWVKKGTKVIVQVVKEGLGSKGPALSTYPSLKSRFWVLSARCDRVGVSKKIVGVERTRLKVIAKSLQLPGFGLTVRTVAAGHSLEELQKDLDGLLSTWKHIIEHAKSAAIAADEGVNGAVPVILHQAMGQTLSVVQDYFNEKVETMIVDSQRTYLEVTSYLQEIAPDLCERVKLYDKRVPIFDQYGVEEEINNILSKRVPLPNGGSLVIEQTEALVSIDVNGGHGMLGQETSQEKAILDVNLTAAKQIARELRLRDIGGIIVVDFIDMIDDGHKRLVYEEIKKAVEQDRSMVKVSELSRHGLMEITRKRVRPSVTFMISEPCTCCHATGRVESLETTFSKIEHEICRELAISNQKSSPENAKSWPKFVLRVDRYMCNYLTSGKRTKLAVLCSSLKVWILLKVARGFSRGIFEVKPFAEDKAESEKKPIALSALKSSENGSYISSGKLTLFPVKKWKATRR